VDHPQKLVLEGSVADIPFISGDCDDEGTVFAFSSVNVTTDAETHNYLKEFFFPTAPSSDVDQLLKEYPANITLGSPFDTGTANALTPQYKRIAAILGDFIFTAPRRFLLQQRSGRQQAWSFLNKRFKTLPFIGSGHGSDQVNVYGPGDLTDYLVNFVNNLDPNGPTVLNWPKYNTSSAQLLTLLDGAVPQALTTDTFRKEGMAFITKLGLAFPLQ